MEQAGWDFDRWMDICSTLLRAVNDRNLPRDEIDRCNDLFRLAKREALKAHRAFTAFASASE